MFTVPPSFAMLPSFMLPSVAFKAIPTQSHLTPIKTSKQNSIKTKQLKTILKIPETSPAVAIPFTSKSIPKTAHPIPSTSKPMARPINIIFCFFIVFIKLTNPFQLYFHKFINICQSIYSPPNKNPKIIGKAKINAIKITTSAILSPDFGTLLSTFPVWPFIYVI